MIFRREHFSLLLLVPSIFLSGCSTVANKVPHDPWEGFNRQVYVFNDTLDIYALKPAAKGYKAVTPDIVETGVRNFFANLGDVRNFVNNLLQLKFVPAGIDLSRIAFNTTMGLGGLIDVATPLGYPRSNEDFGQTLGTWGLGSGPYVVMPFLGPSTLRDVSGLPVDWVASPVRYVESNSDQWALVLLDTVSLRAELLKASSIRDTAALDPYIFTREAFLQRRVSLVNDGQTAANVGENEEFDEDELLDDD